MEGSPPRSPSKKLTAKQLNALAHTGSSLTSLNLTSLMGASRATYGDLEQQMQTIDPSVLIAQRPTILMRIAASGNRERINLLFQAIQAWSPDRRLEFMEARDNYNRTALGYAISTEPGDAANKTIGPLLDNGVDLNTQLDILEKDDEHLDTVLIRNCNILMLASYKNKRKNIIELLTWAHDHLSENEYSAFINSVNSNGESCLSYVARKGNSEIARLLLGHGANVNAAMTDDGMTALMWAVQENHPPTASLLLEHGAIVDATKTNGMTALMLACGKGHLGTVTMLVERGANVNAVQTDGMTTLMFACLNGYLDIVRFLIHRGANVNAVKTNGKTPLLYAIESDNLDIIKLLVERGADMNAARVSDGLTALIWASQEGQTSSASLLIDNGANVNAACTDDGTTALMLASEFNHLDIVRLLIHKSANVNAVRTNDGATALMLASEFNHPEIVRLLMEGGANVNATRTIPPHETALMLATTDEIRNLLNPQVANPIEGGRKHITQVHRATQVHRTTRVHCTRRKYKTRKNKKGRLRMH